MSVLKHRAKKITANSQVVAAPIVAQIGNMELNADQAYRLIMAAGHDLAGSRARKAGRTVWSRGDYNAACHFTDRLFKATGLAS